VFRPSEFIYGVEDVWLIWLTSLVLFALLIRSGLKRVRWSNPRSFLRDEHGASYALSYVLTFPIYLLVVCVMMQATMILLCKMGTVYAAYAAARAAVVWRSVEPDAASPDGGKALALNKARQAAVRAMTPFASSYGRHLTWKGANVNSTEAKAYFEAYQKYSPDDLAREVYVKSKYAFAEKATTVTITGEPNEWNKDVKAEVTYDMPMSIPGAGRILGQGSAANFFNRPITSTAVLTSETPVSTDETPADRKGRLGIPYDPRY